MQWNERHDTASEIIGLTDAREIERRSASPHSDQPRTRPRPGSVGRWIGFALLGVLLGGWLLTALTRAL